MLSSFCLVAITGSGLGIIYNHNDNNDDTTPVLSMFMRTWRTTQENSATIILYGSSLG
jgi:hypothetical protein